MRRRRRRRSRLLEAYPKIKEEEEKIGLVRHFSFCRGIDVEVDCCSIRFRRLFFARDAASIASSSSTGGSVVIELGRDR